MNFWIQKIKHNGIGLMILASVLFSIMGAMAKLVMHRLPFMEAVFFRALITFILLAPYLYVKKIPFLGNHKQLLFVRSFSGFVALSLIFYVTTQIPLADAALLNHTSTIFVALLSVFFLGEKLTPLLGGYILLAFGGAAMIMKPGFEWNWQAGLLGLLSGLFAAFAYIAIKKLHHRESFLTMVFDFSLVSAIGSCIWLIVTAGFVPLMRDEWFYVLILGVSGTFAQMLMTYAYKYAPASIVSPYQFSTVLFSALWGSLFWGERPDVYSLMGAVLIIACGVGILRINKKGIEEVPYV